MKKNIVILGGSSGIGESTAFRFASEGWRVIIASCDSEGLLLVKSKLPGEGHVSIEFDVRNDADLFYLRSELEKNNVNRIDVIVNSIGISEQYHVLDSDFEAWDNTLQVMLYGAIKSCRTLVPLVPNGGRIIHITSIHYNRVEKGSSSYGIAKAAITQFTRSLALELADRNILANTVAPGFIDAPMAIKKNGVNELDTEWFYDNYIKYDHLPLKRPGKPEEVAGVVFFLAGSDASYMTGSVLTVDGGMTITF